jgi:hypothetical protein
MQSCVSPNIAFSNPSVEPTFAPGPASVVPSLQQWLRADTNLLQDPSGRGPDACRERTCVAASAKQSGLTRHILLMTATITPNHARNLVRTDPAARLKDYKDALGFYLALIDRPLHGIVFVENSDSDVTTLRQLVASRGLTGRVEFLCNYGVHLYSEKGRAHGEFKLLDYAMTASVMVHEAGPAHVVWKITGRYIVKNLSSMIATAPGGFDAYVDMKDHPKRWMDMRLMAWTAAGYDRVFRGAADDLDSKTHEIQMRDYLPKRAKGARLVPRFCKEPFIDGIRGWDNNSYSSARELIKCYVRSIGRVVAPWYWI